MPADDRRRFPGRLQRRGIDGQRPLHRATRQLHAACLDAACRQAIEIGAEPRDRARSPGREQDTERHAPTIARDALSPLFTSHAAVTRGALNCCSMRAMHVRSWVLASAAGLLAGGVALGVAELVAGLVPGAPSPVSEIGALLIAYQPRGAEQLVVSLLGKADKPVLTIAVALAGLLLSAGLGVVARAGTPLRWAAALAGFGALGLLALVAAFRDPLVDPMLAIGVFAVSLGLTWWVLSRLLRLAANFEERRAGRPAEMPDWSRRRFIGNTLTFGVTALASGAIGR